MMESDLPICLSRNLQVSIGCDPEVFAFNKADNYPRSVHNLLPGSKAVPHPVPRGSIQVDGTAAEFNIHPVKTRDAWIIGISEVLSVLRFTLRQKTDLLEFKILPTVMFNKNYFHNLPMYAKELGCQPDFSAYTLKPNKKPQTKLPIRTAAGHIHIGWLTPDPERDIFSEEYISLCAGLVKELDFVLYNTSLMWDSDSKRRTLYGKPGAFRPKPYGLEYRVLSNMWLKDVGLQKYVFDVSKSVSTQYLKGRRFYSKYSREGPVLADFDYNDLSDFLYSQKIPCLTDPDYRVP